MYRSTFHALITRRVLLSVLAMIFMFSSATALADSAICNNCTNQQFKNKAILLGQGFHYVVDFENDILNKYWVTYEPALHEWRATPMPAEQDYIDAVAVMSRIYNQTNGSMKITYIIDARNASGLQGVTGWDIAGPGPEADIVANWLWNRAGTEGDWRNFFTLGEVQLVTFAAGVINVLSGLDPEATLRIVFEDESTTEFTCGFWQSFSQMDLSPVPGSSRDSFGNVIPHVPADADDHQYEYRYGGSNPMDPSRMSGRVNDLIGAGTVFYVSHAYICADNGTCKEIF